LVDFFLQGYGVMTRNKGYPRRSGYPREDKDFYVEPRWVVHRLLDVETFEGFIHDPCCGTGTIPSVCMERGLVATGSDIADRGFGEVRDLFSLTELVDNMISNVPYGIAEECARHMIKLVRRKLALILPMTFWESRRRDQFFQKYPPIRWFPCSDRPSMPPGRMDGERDRCHHSAAEQRRHDAIWLVHLRARVVGVTSAIRLPLPLQ
jgi:hypothetical protein